MRKRVIVLMTAAALCLAGCGGKDKMPASTTDEVDKYAEQVQESGKEGFITPSEAVKNLLIKTWNVDGASDVYTMESDGTGTKNEEPFTFECGFDEDNHITLQIKLDDSGEEIYAITSDNTGYCLNLDSLNGGRDIRLVPADLDFLTAEDERASGIVGEWEDQSGNQYVFDKNNKLVIKGAESDTEGTYSAVQNSEGVLLLNLVVPGGALEYEYTLNDDHTQMELCSPGTDVVHVWTKG